MKNKILLLILTIIGISLTSCTTASSIKSMSNTKENKTTIKSTTTSIVTTTKEKYKDDYAFTYFKQGVEHESEVITDGLVLVKNTLYKTDDKKVIIYALEVDLNKVTIKAGTYNNESYNFSKTRAVPYSMATAYENKTGGTVYASINADFFGDTVVNAFVKDGFIIKNAHNSNGSFDYTNLEADLPASAPMLFGIKENTAQVKPIRSYSGDITDESVKRTVVTSQLSYKLVHGDTIINTSASLNFTTSKVTLSKGSVYALVDITGGASNLKVLSINTLDENTQLSAPSAGKGYVYSMQKKQTEEDFIAGLKENDTIGLIVKSATNTWNGYTTILGCRQALIIDGAIAETVKLENSNGAQSNNVPRSSVGIKEDGTVVVFGVESMYYGGVAKASDSYGVSLPELAEFMYYYNIVDGANFDGGGSTQLLVRRNNELNVIIRSSDTGSSKASESRKVMNALLVTSKDSE